VATDALGAGAKKTFFERMLDGVERVGNKVPHAALIFVALCVIVIGPGAPVHLD
jgi:p-aminobenzoyl-glutamate transporter AbgT